MSHTTINVLLALEYIWNLTYFCCVWINKIIIKGRSSLSYRFSLRTSKEPKPYKMDSTFPDTTSLTFNLTSHNAFKLPCSGRSTVEVVKGPNLSYNTCTCTMWCHDFNQKVNWENKRYFTQVDGEIQRRQYLTSIYWFKIISLPLS